MKEKKQTEQSVMPPIADLSGGASDSRPETSYVPFNPHYVIYADTGIGRTQTLASSCNWWMEPNSQYQVHSFKSVQSSSPFHVAVKQSSSTFMAMLDIPLPITFLPTRTSVSNQRDHRLMTSFLLSLRLASVFTSWHENLNHHA